MYDTIRYDTDEMASLI